MILGASTTLTDLVLALDAIHGLIQNLRPVQRNQLINKHSGSKTEYEK